MNNADEILKILRDNQNPIDPSTITYSFIGVIAIFALFGFIYGFKKGITFLVAAIISMGIGFLTYESFGELIYQQVILPQIPEVDVYITSLAKIGINVKEVAYGAVGIVYLLLLTWLGTFILGVPAYMLVKKVIFKNKELSMKEKELGRKLGNRFLGMGISAAASLLFGFFVFSAASPAIGVFFDPNEVAFHKLYLGEQKEEENAGRVLFNAAKTGSELTGEENSETLNTLVDIAKNKGGDSTNAVKDTLSKKELIPTLDKTLDLIQNALKKEGSTVEEVVGALQDLGFVEEDSNLATGIADKLKDIVKSNPITEQTPQPIQNYIDAITKKGDGETDADVEAKVELVKKGIEILKLIGNKLLIENSLTKEENDKLQAILNTYK